jgi:hypothetical protein
MRRQSSCKSCWQCAGWVDPAAHVVGQHQIRAAGIARQGAGTQSQHGVGAGKQVALGAQRITRTVEAFNQKHFTPGVGFKLHIGHVQAQLRGHVHHHKLTRGQVRGIAPVLQFGQPQLALVLHRELGRSPPALVVASSSSLRTARLAGAEWSSC